MTSKNSILLHNTEFGYHKFSVLHSYELFNRAEMFNLLEAIENKTYVYDDIINIDISVYYKGYHGDLNETYIVGKPDQCDETSKKLIQTTYESLMLAIQYGTYNIYKIFYNYLLII